MQKIKSITLRNFIYFFGKETEQPLNKVELDKQNLLLYGENASGKSSIYWAYILSGLLKDSSLAFLINTESQISDLALQISI